MCFPNGIDTERTVLTDILHILTDDIDINDSFTFELPQENGKNYCSCIIT
jgi:hypothetical protein